MIKHCYNKNDNTEIKKNVKFETIGVDKPKKILGRVKKQLGSKTTYSDPGNSTNKLPPSCFQDIIYMWNKEEILL